MSVRLTVAFSVLLSLSLIGCCAAAKRTTRSLEGDVARLKQEIAAKDQELANKDKSIKEQLDLIAGIAGMEKQLKEKDAAIAELKDKLKAFGVFQ